MSRIGSSPLVRALLVVLALTGASPGSTQETTLRDALTAEHLPTSGIAASELSVTLGGISVKRGTDATLVGYSGSPDQSPHLGVLRYDWRKGHLRSVAIAESPSTIIEFRHQSPPSQQCVSPSVSIDRYGPDTYLTTQQTPSASCVFVLDAQLVPIQLFSGFIVAFSAGRYALLRESEVHFSDNEPQLELSVYDATTNRRTPIYPVAGDSHVAGLDLTRGKTLGAPQEPVFAFEADPNGPQQTLARRPTVDYLFVFSGGTWRSASAQSDRLRATFGVDSLSALLRLPLRSLTEFVR